MSKDKILEIINNSDILNKIKEERVFDVTIYEENENHILITENCDCWFSSELNKKEILELAKVLNEIANEMNDEGEKK